MSDVTSVPHRGLTPPWTAAGGESCRQWKRKGTKCRREDKRNLRIQRSASRPGSCMKKAPTSSPPWKTRSGSGCFRKSECGQAEEAGKDKVIPSIYSSQWCVCVCVCNIHRVVHQFVYYSYVFSLSSLFKCSQLHFFQSFLIC